MTKTANKISFILIVAAIAVIMSIISIDAAAEETVGSGSCGENLTWTLDDGGTLTISGTGDMEDWYYSFSAPWFGNRASITKAVIEDGVTSIGEWAFMYCDSLTSITIPDSVTSIGEYAFWNCDSLTSIIIPDSVTSIGDGAFKSCNSLTSVNIPNSVTSIGEYAFSFCYGLTSVNISDSVANIGEYAFYKCSSLTSINIPNSVTSIGVYAFYECSDLISVSIGNSVTSIGDWAFDGCNSLTSVSIPDSVTSIGYAAFWSCASLTDVYYGGTEVTWAAISMGGNNVSLTSDVIHYNSSLPASTGAVGEQTEEIKVIVNNTPIAFDVPPVIIDGTTMLPVRLALEPLGAEFEWNGGDMTVTIHANEKDIVLTIGTETALVDGAEKPLAKPAVITDGRTLIPVRFVAEELGYNVDWDGETRTVIITAAE